MGSLETDDVGLGGGGAVGIVFDVAAVAACLPAELISVKVRFFPSAEVLFPVYIIFHRDVEAGHRVVIPSRQTGPCMAIF